MNSMIPSQTSAQAYDELKKRLLSEYKKMSNNKKGFDEQVREKYKNIKQRAVSGKKPANSHQMNTSIGNNQVQMVPTQPTNVSSFNQQ